MCARGSEAQRAESATRHQGRSQQGGAKFLGSKIPGFIRFFFAIPGVYLGIYLASRDLFKETLAKNGENAFLSRVASLTKRKCDL